MFYYDMPKLFPFPIHIPLSFFIPFNVEDGDIEAGEAISVPPVDGFSGYNECSGSAKIEFCFSSSVTSHNLKHLLTRCPVYSIYGGLVNASFPVSKQMSPKTLLGKLICCLSLYVCVYI